MAGCHEWYIWDVEFVIFRLYMPLLYCSKDECAIITVLMCPLGRLHIAAAYFISPLKENYQLTAWWFVKGNSVCKNCTHVINYPIARVKLPFTIQVPQRSQWESWTPPEEQINPSRSACLLHTSVTASWFLRSCFVCCFSYRVQLKAAAFTRSLSPQGSGSRRRSAMKHLAIPKWLTQLGLPEYSVLFDDEYDGVEVRAFD